MTAGRASSTALFLAAIGALGIPLLLLAELDSLPATTICDRDRFVATSRTLRTSCR